MKTVGILLAAGQSKRFGAENKLLTDFKGKPLVHHAANALQGAKLDCILAVISKNGVPAELLNMPTVINDSEQCAQSDNLRLGLKYAIKQNADKVVIVLGDMPFVTPQTIQAISNLCTKSRCSAAMSSGHKLPPVAIPVSLFSEVMSSEGDQGARGLIQALPPESCFKISPKEALDIDTQDQLFTAVNSS